MPEDAGWIPSISTGYSSTDVDDSSDDIEGGMSVSSGATSSSKATPSVAAIGSAPNTGDDDDNTIWEVFYKFLSPTTSPSLLPIFGIDDGGLRWLIPSAVL